MLASASAALILPALSEIEPEITVIPKVELEAKIQQKYYTAVEQQVLQHLNPKIPVSERFSRVLRPMPSQYYAAEIVKNGEDGMIEFRIVHMDRLIQENQKPTFVVTGQFNGGSGEVFLMDAASRKYVPAAAHPLIRKSPNT